MWLKSVKKYKVDFMAFSYIKTSTCKTLFVCGAESAGHWMAIVSTSICLEGLQHWLWYSAHVVLMIAQCSKNTSRVHVLHISIVAVCVAMHVRQFTCTRKGTVKWVEKTSQTRFQRLLNNACLRHIVAIKQMSRTSDSIQNGFRSTGVPLLAAWTGEDISRSPPLNKLNYLQSNESINRHS